MNEEEKKTNYEKAMGNAAKQFLTYPLAEYVTEKGFTTEGEYIYLSFLGKMHRINIISGLVDFEAKDGSFYPASFNETMTLYDLICYSRPNCKTAEEYISLPNLAPIHNACSYAGDGMFARQTKLFDKYPKAFEEALLSLGGIRTGKGDVTYRIPIFHHHSDMSVILDFWCADEDFPAQLTILCDQNTLDYMHYETIWYMVVYLLNKVEEAMKIKSMVV